MLKSKLPKLKHKSLNPQPITQIQILTLLKQCNSLKTLKQIHTQLLINSLNHPNHLLSKLIHLQDFHYSILHFSQIPKPNEFSYNIMIRALTSTWENHPLALEFYLKMIKSGEKTDKYTYPFVLKAIGGLRSLNLGRTIHGSVFKLGLDLDEHTSHCLITMYLKCGELGCSRKVFDEIPDKDLVSWNSMISGCSGMGFSKEAVELFEEMKDEGFEPCERTLASVLKACGDLVDKEMGRKLEMLVEERGMEVESFVGSALVNMYGKCGDLVSARRVFDGMKKRELAVWNSMITGYAQNGQPEEAIKLFNAMRESTTEPDKYTIAAVLSACASVGALKLGSWVDDFASRKGLINRNVYISTALVDMYAKCGNLDRAIKIFQPMLHKNVVSWNAMISAMASHGHGQEAIELFHRMLDEKEVTPNDITFVGLLSACVHTGLVDEGRQWFNLMETKFGIVPRIEHYSCMVDLLARAGKVEEAWEFIESMPEELDAVLLGALLNACRNSKNVEIGEKVMRKILELEPLNSGNYVISSKIYVNSNRLEDAARMRGLMKERGVSKTPGCSWIEIDGQAYDFHAGDRLHPETLDLNWVIDLMLEEMKLEGYTPIIDIL
ncbi:uncharacterized protein A4U43_C01F6170 [Asparagus officinalis]|uniref:Pentacotripeptide-repeat region of PRORP domain-containing protein n=1 Tax=Asparagus officinalis TaxID=4686 RepID=A0A5P1FRY2_ASPOF|nr:pentatricopeptide repeat-containing protein At2g34400 [Asparagus officinalis]XP_020275219.1 pentatricopeptide repeat-containing protein At2g34400 [Asparagus officinalis]ONK79420.1 uncharacterized protein A4U43_C01F6170 [Asparagus officinalis]